MTDAINTSHKLPADVLASLISTIGIILFLFFIDEGYYSLKWMLEGGNWILFFIYFIILFPVQLGISEFLMRKVEGSKKLILMLFVVMSLTIVSLMSIFYFIGS